MGGTRYRDSRKQSLPLWSVLFTQQKIPPCGLTSAQPRHWKDLGICLAVNIDYNLNKSQIVKSLGSLPFSFLQPEWKGHSLYILKANKTNKQLGYLLGAEEGVIVSAMWVGKLLTSIWCLLCLFICPSHLITELALKAVACPWSSRRCADPQVGLQVSATKAMKSCCDHQWLYASCTRTPLSSGQVISTARGLSLSIVCKKKMILGKTIEAKRLRDSCRTTEIGTVPRRVWAEALWQWRLKSAFVVWMNLSSATKCAPDAGIKTETFPYGPRKAE